MIPVMKPRLPNSDQLKKWFEKIDQSHVYSNFGPMSWQLRESYSKYLGVDASRIIPLTNATLAIQGALEISSEKNWIVPDYTFAATAHATVAAQKNVYFSDVNLDSFQLEAMATLDLDSFGVIPVMPFGAAIDFSEWQSHASVVIDAAASLGSTPPNFESMPKNSAVIYSLHATKVLGAGEGALVILENEEMASELRSWSNFGFDGSRVSKFRSTNAKMSEFSAAIALASLENFENEKSEWLNALDSIASLDVPGRFRTIVDSYSGFRPYWIIQTLHLEERRQLEDFLRANGVESRSWWASRLSDMPAFTQIKKIGENLNSQILAESHLGLPIWRGISTADLNLIARLLNEFKYSSM
jgi:dTDP-4-amino-4,6-dideoxygalactose transaminase